MLCQKDGYHKEAILLAKRPHWKIRWNGKVTPPDVDGVTHGFDVETGNNEVTIIRVSCSRNAITEFMQDQHPGWTEELAALGMCAQRLKEVRDVYGLCSWPLMVNNPDTLLSLHEARALASGETIDIG